jgi:hypothetical protein
LGRGEIAMLIFEIGAGIFILLIVIPLLSGAEIVSR